MTVLCFAALGVFGCAGAQLNKISSSDELTKELPAEFQKKFEVQDATMAGAQPTTAVVPVKAKKRRRRNEPPPFSFPNRRPKSEPFWLGEKQVYDITYFGVAAGEFSLEVLPRKVMNDREVYHIKGFATSSSIFSLFYRLNDMVETFIDFDGIFSHRFHIVLDETVQTRDSLELFDSQKKQTFYWNRWNHKDRGYTDTKEYAPIESFSQDTLSSLYYLRTVPLPQDAVISVPVVSEAKPFEAIMTVIRREMMDTPMGRVSTVVIKPEMKFQGILKKQGDSFIWLTDDDRRFVVRIEAKVKVGTVVAALKRYDPGTPPVPPGPLGPLGP